MNWGILNELSLEFSNLKNKKAYFRHCNTSKRIAKDLIEDLKKNYPNYFDKLKDLEIIYSAYIHDIGRIISSEQVFHEIFGAEYVSSHPNILKVSKKLSRNISKMILSHGIVYEQFQMEEFNNAKKKIKHIFLKDLIPNTWEQKIIVYSDIKNSGGIPCSLKSRIRKYSDPLFIKAVSRAMPRLLKLEKMFDTLREGKEKIDSISKISFLN